MSVEAVALCVAIPTSRRNLPVVYRGINSPAAASRRKSAILVATSFALTLMNTAFTRTAIVIFILAFQSQNTGFEISFGKSVWLVRSCSTNNSIHSNH